MCLGFIVFKSKKYLQISFFIFARVSLITWSRDEHLEYSLAREYNKILKMKQQYKNVKLHYPIECCRNSVNSAKALNNRNLQPLLIKLEH